jgi:hypothetical protein
MEQLRQAELMRLRSTGEGLRNLSVCRIGRQMCLVGRRMGWTTLQGVGP